MKEKYNLNKWGVFQKPMRIINFSAPEVQKKRINFLSKK